MTVEIDFVIEVIAMVDVNDGATLSKKRGSIPDGHISYCCCGQ